MNDAFDPPRVTALIPCLNEAASLGICIAKAQSAFKVHGILGEVLVADNGSSDESVQIALSHGARVVHEPRKGYGAVLMTGIADARGEIIVMADADDSYDWSRLDEFVAKVDEGYDLVMGNRFKGGIEPGAMPILHRYLGNPVLSTLARHFFRIPIGDFHCGMRAFTRSAAGRMGLRAPGMEFATEMVVAAAHSGLRIGEIPIRLYPDKRGRPPHLRSFRDGWRHLRFMLTHAPDWLYLAPGTLMSLMGLTGLITLARGPIVLGGFPMGIHFLALASLLSILGINVIGFGIFAKVINEPRCQIPPKSAIGRLLRIFTLERGLITGLSLFCGGLAVVVAILSTWLAKGRGDMAETVHLAFFGTTVILLGVNLMFGAFLLYLLQENAQEHGA